MTKNQLAQWIVSMFDKEDDYPCPICTQVTVYNCAIATCDGKCVEHIREALINAHKEMYYSRTLPVYDKETGKEL